MADPLSQIDPKRLQAVRKKLGMTQAEVAEALGVHALTVTRWESGKLTPGGEALLQLAQLYRMSVETLVGTSEIVARGTSDTAIRPGVGEVVAEGYAPTLYVTPRHARNLPLSVREYLAEFHVRLVKGGASEDEIDEAMALLRSPDVFSYFKGGKLAEYNEADVLDGMRSLAEDVVIPRLQKLGRKVK